MEIQWDAVFIIGTSMVVSLFCFRCVWIYYKKMKGLLLGILTALVVETLLIVLLSELFD